jgi:hypothetical protein
LHDSAQGLHAHQRRQPRYTSAPAPKAAAATVTSTSWLISALRLERSSLACLIFSTLLSFSASDCLRTGDIRQSSQACWFGDTRDTERSAARKLQAICLTCQRRGAQGHDGARLGYPRCVRKGRSRSRCAALWTACCNSLMGVINRAQVRSSMKRVDNVSLSDAGQRAGH